MKHIQESDVVILLQHGYGAKDIAGELEISVEQAQELIEKIRGGNAKTADQIKTQLEQEYGSNLEELAIKSILEVMTDTEANGSSRVQAAKDLQTWLNKDGKTINMPEQLRKLNDAAKQALPSDLSILDRPNELPEDIPQKREALNVHDIEVNKVA